MGLDTDTQRASTSLKTELRRRLWYGIGILDMQAAFDGGSHSVITHNISLGRQPLTIDDAALSHSHTNLSEFYEPSAFTNMSFASMTHEALVCWKRLTYVPTDYDGQPLKGLQDWTKRSEILKECERQIHNRILRYCDRTSPFQNLVAVVGEDIIVTMRLLERRPLHRISISGPPPADGFNVLNVATEVLEKSLVKITDERLIIWSWFAWVKWYALAVLLAELCGHGNGSLANRAWKVAEVSMEKYASLMIDEGLWKSIEKLMQKARSVRDRRSSTSLQAPESVESRTASSPVPQKNGTVNEALSAQEINPAWQGTLSVDKLPASMDEGLGSSSLFAPTDSSASIAYPSADILDSLMEDSDMMTWLNWESFVQDIGDFNAPNMPNISDSALQY